MRLCLDADASLSPNLNTLMACDKRFASLFIDSAALAARMALEQGATPERMVALATAEAH
jgi:hypothetical protein